MCLKIYKLDPAPAHFLSAPGLAWKAAVKKTGVKLELLLTDIGMILMVEKGIRGGIKKELYGPFLWMGFNCLKTTEPLLGGSLLFTAKFPEIPSTHLIHLGKMKD